MIHHLHPDLAHIPENEESILAWNARQWIPRKRSWLWWTVAALKALLIGGFAIYLGIPMLGVLAMVILIYLALYALLANPKVETIALTGNGIWIDEEFIPYEEIDEFRTIYAPPRQKKVKGKNESVTVSPPLSVLELHIRKGRYREIELEDQSPVEVRDVLLHFVPESEDRSAWPHVLRHVFNL